MCLKILESFLIRRQVSCSSVRNTFSFPSTYNDHVRRDKETGAQDQKPSVSFLVFHIAWSKKVAKLMCLNMGVYIMIVTFNIL